MLIGYLIIVMVAFIFNIVVEYKSRTLTPISAQPYVGLVQLLLWAIFWPIEIFLVVFVILTPSRFRV